MELKVRKARHYPSFRGSILTCPVMPPVEASSWGVVNISADRLVLVSRPAERRGGGAWLMRGSGFGWFAGAAWWMEGPWGTAEAEGRVEDLKPCEQCMATKHASDP